MPIYTSKINTAAEKADSQVVDEGSAGKGRERLEEALEVIALV